MMRDFFGNRIKVNPLTGKTLSKKQIKREVIAENRRKGKETEQAYVLQATIAGYEVERTGRGHDFKVRKRNPFTGKVTYTGYREIKSSATAPVSKLQQKTKKNKSNYKVIRREGWF